MGWCARGITGGPGRARLRKALARALEDEAALGPVMAALVRELRADRWRLDARIAAQDAAILDHLRRDARCRLLATVPGIGPVTASASVAAIDSGQAFARARDPAAWLGLVPGQHSTGGRDRLLGISKHGNRHPRTLLVHGARAVRRSRHARVGRLGARLDRLEARARQRGDRGAGRQARPHRLRGADQQGALPGPVGLSAAARPHPLCGRRGDGENRLTARPKPGKRTGRGGRLGYEAGRARAPSRPGAGPRPQAGYIRAEPPQPHLKACGPGADHTFVWIRAGGTALVGRGPGDARARPHSIRPCAPPSDSPASVRHVMIVADRRSMALRIRAHHGRGAAGCTLVGKESRSAWPDGKWWAYALKDLPPGSRNANDLRVSDGDDSLPPPPLWRTKYYERATSRRDWRDIRPEEVRVVKANPTATARQPDGRFRPWGWIAWRALAAPYRRAGRRNDPQRLLGPRIQAMTAESPILYKPSTDTLRVELRLWRPRRRTIARSWRAAATPPAQTS